MNKHITKSLSSLMILSVMASFCLMFSGCTKIAPDGKRGTDGDLQMLQSREGVMFVLSSEVIGPIDWYNDDRIMGATYTVNWDGTVTKTIHYLSSGDIEAGKAVLSDNDYMKIYSFAEKAYHNDSYRNYHEDDVCDGSMYSFVFYPEDSDKEVHLFSGYCYSNKKLWSIVELLYSYFEISAVATPTPVPTLEELKARFLYMMTISVDNMGLYSPYDDEYCLTTYLIRWSGEIASCTTHGKTKGEWKYADLNDEDYMTLYSFAVDAYENGTYSSYSEQGGEFHWRFKYDPVDKDEYEIYYGSVSESKELSNIAEIVSSYIE